MTDPALSAEVAETPTLEIPVSSDTVNVYVIDTTTRIHMPVGTMFEPVIKGHTKLASPSYAFLIEHERLEKRILFDLGTPKDWRMQAPLENMLEEYGWDLRVEKNVAEILEEYGVLPSTVNAIVWRSVL